MKKRALITGISGQDGSYLSEYLLSLNYDVYGIVRRNSVAENQQYRIEHIKEKLNIFYGDLTDQTSIEKVLTEVKPDEIYNLAAQSHVRISFDIPQYTAQTNALGVLNILEAYKRLCPTAKFYQASSCLPAGTKILVQKEMSRHRYGKKQTFLTLGTKPIEQITTEDKVLSYNFENGKKEYKKIEAIGNRIATDMYTLIFSNGNQLRLSGNHPVYVHNKGWTRTDELLEGNEVIQKRYHGLVGRMMKDKKFDEIFGKEHSLKIRKMLSYSQQNTAIHNHPWKGKTIKEVYIDNPEKLKDIHDAMSTGQKNSDYPGWNYGLTAKTDIRLERIGKKISIAHKNLWSKPEHAQRMMLAFRKVYNKREEQFFNLLEEICPSEFGYNGDGRIKLFGTKMPDFINLKGKQKLIEFYGDYWHRNDVPGQRVKYFKDLGWEVLEIWQSEFLKDKENVKQKIKNYIYNPDTDVIKITKIIKHDYSEKVYDIQVEDNHNFFAHGILVHNSEMFGLSVDEDKFQRETTIMNPVSPYGTAKVFGYNIVRHYRRAYNLHACNGILFNHESPRRGSNFVTSKVIKSACMIKLGMLDKLEMGNMDSYRDWGHSKDYVRAMHAIINHEKADDFVVSTMETNSVRNMCEVVFSYLDLDYKKYVIQNPKYMRPEELPYLRGDSTKTRTILGWKPDYDFKMTMYEMVDHWMDILQNKPSLR